MRRVDVDTAIERKYPEWITLVVVPDGDGANVMPACWCTFASHEPPMLAVSVGRERYTHGLLEDAAGFVVAFPSADQREAVLYCGEHSGAAVDKFAATDLEPEPAAQVEAPLVADTVACYECRAADSLAVGDHTLFTGEIVAGHVSDREAKLYNRGGFERRGTASFDPVSEIE